MIPSKEAKEMLYSLLAENFVTLQVIITLIIPLSFLLLLSEHTDNLRPVSYQLL